MDKFGLKADVILLYLPYNIVVLKLYYELQHKSYTNLRKRFVNKC